MNELTQQEVDAMAFKTAFLENVRRKGAEELLDWLEGTDFFTAPAGARHHGAYPGGLVAHSLNVYNELRMDFITRTAAEKLSTSTYSRERVYLPTEEEEETLAVCGLLHDVCKVGVYHEKDGGGYEFRDKFPMGHGEKSVFLMPWATINTFWSMEPLLGPVDMADAEGLPQWVIMGAETGNRQIKVIPRREWVDQIAAFCAENEIPVFYKDNLREYFPDLPASAYPWEV